jgi:hypothetical protein
MPGRMIVHDKRLAGTAPPIAPNIYVVDATVDIQHCVGWIGEYARSQGGLSELLIMCHGFEANWDLGRQMSTTQRVGGFGLQLCREGLSLYNVGLVRSWNGRIGRITVYACAPADTGSGNEGTAGDGTRFMGEMALWSGAEVIAARDTQTYTFSPTKPIDFGNWEGPVYRFDPSTGNRSNFAAGKMR